MINNRYSAYIIVGYLNLVKLLTLGVVSIQFILGYNLFMKYLDASANLIDSIEELGNLTKLISVSLQSNRIRSIKCVNTMRELVSLRLDANLITTVDGLEQLGNLNYLRLSSNQIRSVAGLANLTKLEHLQLNSNQIDSTLELASLTKLNVAFLVKNKLTSVSSRTFGRLRSLHTVLLDSNEIETVEALSFFNLTNLKLISLTGNRIHSIGENAFNSIKSNNKLDLYSNMMLTEITRTSFKGILYLRISYESLLRLRTYNYTYFDVDTLDVSNNRISVLFTNSIKGLFRVLILKENSLTLFESNAFSRMPNLSEIDLSKNLIKSLNFESSFEMALERLTKLDVQFNKIKSISPVFFAKFPNLLHLDMSNNNLYLINRDYFLNLNRLEQLNLSNNQILTIEQSSFGYIIGLRGLNLKNNLVYDLRGNLFENLSRLSELMLSQNKLESISRSDFAGLSSLKSLDISENLLKHLQTDSFAEISQLSALNLSSNRIHFLNDSLHILRNISQLDLSYNNVTHVSFADFENSLTYLDLSHNQFSNDIIIRVENLKTLSLSNTNADFIVNLNFSNQSRLKNLDLSYNNLTRLRSDFFANLTRLIKLNLKETCLVHFEFLSLLISIEQINLSNNLVDDTQIADIQYSSFLISVNIGNVSMNEFQPLVSAFISYVDISHNNLTFFNAITNVDCITHLIMSHNRFYFVLSGQTEIKDFMAYYQRLTFINMDASLVSSMANKVFYFNWILEYASLAANGLETFPCFCQTIYEDYIRECQLKTVYFNSNKLNMVLNRDLANLINLEYLNLENNQINSIENESFAYLANLDTLILSRNRLSDFNDSSAIFASLGSLKSLNLSFNSIEVISSYLFSNLLKLESLDLSYNKIYLFEDYSMNKLNSLRYLHLHENAKRIEIRDTSFVALDAIQNVYVSKSILSNETRRIFVDLFQNVNRNAETRNKRLYFKSLSLVSPGEVSTTDCDLTLYFIRRNIHFNLKTDQEMDQFLMECSHFILKVASSATIRPGKVFVDRNKLVFSEFFIYFVWMYLASVTCLSIYFCAIEKKNIYSNRYVANRS